MDESSILSTIVQYALYYVAIGVGVNSVFLLMVIIDHFRTPKDMRVRVTSRSMTMSEAVSILNGIVLGVLSWPLLVMYFLFS